MAGYNPAPLLLPHYAKSQVEAPRAAGIPVAIGRAGIKRKRIPRAAATNFYIGFVRAGGVAFRRVGIVILVVPVVRPFPDVAEHVVQPPGVRPVAADLGRERFAGLEK